MLYVKKETEWKNCKNLRAHVQVSLQESLSPCSISKKLKREIKNLPCGCELCEKYGFTVQLVDMREKKVIYIRSVANGYIYIF